MSVMAIAPVLVPVPEGVKVTLMLQVPPAPTLLPHPFEAVKSPAFAPVTVILVIFSVEPPVLVSVIA